MSTFVVNGFKLRYRGNRRYVVVATRALNHVAGEGAYVAFAHIHKRSDNLDTARAHARRYGQSYGAHAVIIDTTTGMQIT